MVKRDTAYDQKESGIRLEATKKRSKAKGTYENLS